MQTAPIYNYTIEQNSTHSVITYKKSPVSLGDWPNIGLHCDSGNPFNLYDGKT